MHASLTFPCPTGESRIHLSAPTRPDLDITVRLGENVRAVVDLAAPDRWSEIAISPWESASKALLTAMMGDAATASLTRLQQDPLRTGSQHNDLAFDLTGAGPWLRLAVVDGLDRWLQLPLDQSLIDAERAVARFEAVSPLSGGALRSGLIGEALFHARCAAPGVTRYLRGLAASNDGLPAALSGALARLVQGFRGLSRLVDGPDQALSGVLNSWSALATPSAESNRPRTAPNRPTRYPQENQGPPARSAAARNLMDPRQVRARTVALGADPALAEVEMLDRGDGKAVLVNVPAFGLEPSPEMADRLLVRLVERSSGRSRGEGVLTLLPWSFRPGRPGPHSPVFQGVVALHGGQIQDVRADVFDLDSDVPPAHADTDADLQRARRANVFLREWRRLVTDALLETPVHEPAHRLAVLSGMLATGKEPGRPAFHGGPSASDLMKLSRDGDTLVLQRLRRPGSRDSFGSSLDDWLAAAHGPAAPLVAEFARAHRQS